MLLKKGLKVFTLIISVLIVSNRSSWGQTAHKNLAETRRSGFDFAPVAEIRTNRPPRCRRRTGDVPGDSELGAGPGREG